MFVVLYYKLLIVHGIYVNKEYQFVYDEFFEHLMSDTNILFDKKYTTLKNGANEVEYKQQVFKKIFINHLHSHIFYRLIHPENFPELKRRLRINKLNKINEYQTI